MNRATGVYKWTNTVNGKVYIGSAARGITIRLREHLKSLTDGVSPSRHLQYAWNKYGRKAFKFSVVEFCVPSLCIEREEFWINHFQATNPEFGYNLCRVGNNHLGIKRSEATIAKKRGKKMPPSFSVMLSERNRNHVWTPESRAKKSESVKKMWQDPVWRANQIAKRIGRKPTEETRKKMSESQRKRTWTEETRKKTSDTKKLRSLIHGEQE